MITIAQRYPWQSSETEEGRSFAAVDSIGVNRDESGEAEIVYTVYLRLKTRRRVYLWTIRPRGRHGRELITFLETDRDLESLQRLGPGSGARTSSGGQPCFSWAALSVAAQ